MKQQEMTLLEALRAMGYSEVRPGLWVKPIGYQAFAYHERRNEWGNWFLSGKEKVQCYERKNFKLEDDVDFYEFLRQLKDFECWTRTDLFVYGQSSFEITEINF